MTKIAELPRKPLLIAFFGPLAATLAMVFAAGMAKALWLGGWAVFFRTPALAAGGAGVYSWLAWRLQGRSLKKLGDW